MKSFKLNDSSLSVLVDLSLAGVSASFMILSYLPTKPTVVVCSGGFVFSKNGIWQLPSVGLPPYGVTASDSAPKLLVCIAGESLPLGVF